MHVAFENGLMQRRSTKGEGGRVVRASGGNKSKQLLCKAVLLLVQPKTVSRATRLAGRNKNVF